MVICKYFLQGTCRFGDSCKNEHAYNENPSSVLTKKQDIDINVLIKAAAGDMVKSEKGNQWPFTCYGPFQNKPCFPGFEDKSFEEVRIGYYEAQQNGTLDQYKQQLAQSLHETQLKMRALQNPSPEASNMLKNIYYNTQNSFTNSSNSIFGNKPPNYSNSVFGNTSNFTQPTNSIFGNNQNFSPTNSIFNSTPSNQGSFSNTGSIFGGATQNYNPNQNLFAPQIANQSPAQNVFTSSANNLFTNPPNPNLTSTAPSQNIFTSAPQNVFTSSPNVFTSVAPNQNIFTNTQSAFTAPAQQNVFASAASNIFSNKNSIFANNAPKSTTTNIFGGPPQFSNPTPTAPVNNTQSIFGSSQNQPSFNQISYNQSNSPFVSSSAPANIFQQGNFNQNSVFSQNASQSHSANIFGNNVGQTVVSNVKRVDDPTVYSKLSDLTSNDITQFESQCFEFGKIPIRAPPLEMC